MLCSVSQKQFKKYGFETIARQDARRLNRSKGVVQYFNPDFTRDLKPEDAAQAIQRCDDVNIAASKSAHKRKYGLFTSDEEDEHPLMQLPAQKKLKPATKQYKPYKKQQQKQQKQQNRYNNDSSDSDADQQATVTSVASMSKSAVVAEMAQTEKDINALRQEQTKITEQLQRRLSAITQQLVLKNQRVAELDGRMNSFYGVQQDTHHGFVMPQLDQPLQMGQQPQFSPLDNADGADFLIGHPVHYTPTEHQPVILALTSVVVDERVERRCSFDAALDEIVPELEAANLSDEITGDDWKEASGFHFDTDMSSALVVATNTSL